MASCPHCMHDAHARIVELTTRLVVLWCPRYQRHPEACLSYAA